MLAMPYMTKRQILCQFLIMRLILVSSINRFLEGIGHDILSSRCYVTFVLCTLYCLFAIRFSCLFHPLYSIYCYRPISLCEIFVQHRIHCHGTEHIVFSVQGV